MYTIELKNCGNIISGKIEIEEFKLNIKHGINGTGKSTISKSLKLANKENLFEVQSFYSSNPPEVNVVPDLSTVISFDEEFVNQLVFLNDEVIGDSFEVFIKTPNYEEKKRHLEDRLNRMHKIIYDDEQIIRLRRVVNEVNAKFKKNTNGALSVTGMLKSIVNKQSEEIPSELVEYESFIKSDEISIPWIEWKGKGDQFDIADRCPYCAEILERSKHDNKKQVFKNTYSKTDSQNLTDMLIFLNELREYLDVDKYNTLVECVKHNVDKKRIQL